MIGEAFGYLSGWSGFDTWIVITAALAAMACALPGNFLLLRRQSMMGDALSHTTLLGLIGAFLLMHVLGKRGLIAEDNFAVLQTGMMIGAVVIGVGTAVLTETLRKLGGVESSAALGVVYTTFFALGLLLVRLAADSVHIDAKCVLYGEIETVVLNRIPGTPIPREAAVIAGLLTVNLLLVLLFFKELQIAAFDPELASAMGIHAGAMHYALMCVTATTLVAAFRSVGSILVVAMLIVPPATAYLLTTRLSRMIAYSLVIAAASAVLGHAMAISLPPVIFHRLGFPSVTDASTSGMMAAAAGVLFVAALAGSPRSGWIRRGVDAFLLRLRIVEEDILGALYRNEEDPAASAGLADVAGGMRFRRFWVWMALGQLRRRKQIDCAEGRDRLTEPGRLEAVRLVRSHRLFEAYMARHFAVPDDHLHATAARVEHFIDAGMRQELATELAGSAQDPHGKEIPSDPHEAPTQPHSGPSPG